MYIKKKQVEMRDVVGYENLYGVTNDGRVWSYRNKCWLQQFENNAGYIVQHKTLLEKNSTKSEESQAEFELLPQFKRILLDLKDQQDENRKVLGNSYNDTGYVFVWDNGDFYKPNWVTRKFRNTLKSAGLPPMRFHDLRHSTASILFDLGWDIERIKNWLRHADIETTVNTPYGHTHPAQPYSIIKQGSDPFIMRSELIH